MQILGKSVSRNAGVATQRIMTVLAFSLTALLSGCSSDGDFQDLRSFMDQVKAKPPGAIEPLPPFEQVAPFAYQASNMRSPFEPPVQIRPRDTASGPQVKPDPNRPKQYLEQFTIGNLVMVGTLSQDALTYGLVQDADGGVHRVQRGDYMGTDNGKILAIQETEIELIEIVPDGTGGWVQRSRTVSLGGGDRG